MYLSPQPRFLGLLTMPALLLLLLQVQVILDVLGTPTEADFGFKPRDDAASFLKRQRHRPGITWRQVNTLIIK